MCRHIVVRFLGTLFWLVLANYSPSEEIPPQGNASTKMEGNDRFRVTIWPRVTRVHVGDRFEVFLRIVNGTNKTQSFHMLSSSWYQNWEIDNPGIKFVGYSPINYGDFSVRIKLDPGEAYEQTVEMQIEDGYLRGLTSFKVGFIPLHNKRHPSFWCLGSQKQDFINDAESPLSKPPQTQPSLEKKDAGSASSTSPTNEREIYWSNRVVLGIKPSQHK